MKHLPIQLSQAFRLSLCQSLDDQITKKTQQRDEQEIQKDSLKYVNHL